MENYQKRKEDSETDSSRHERLINACRWLIVHHEEIQEFLTTLFDFLP